MFLYHDRVHRMKGDVTVSVRTDPLCHQGASAGTVWGGSLDRHSVSTGQENNRGDIRSVFIPLCVLASEFSKH